MRRPGVWLGLLAGLTMLRLVVAAVTPLSPDEAYYWVWSQALAAGYLDHPAMVALWIRAGTTLAGPGPLGVRLLGPLAGAAGSVLLYWTARDLLGDGRRALLAAALLNATLLFGVGVVTMTPDTPLLFFWIAALFGCGRLLATGNGRWWLAIGLACGLAAASKYTAGLLPLGVLLWLIWARGMAQWLRRMECWLGAVVGAAMFAPTLLWNAHHGWASFAKQGGRGLVWQPGKLVGHLAELVGGQAGLATPLVFGLCVAGLWAMTRRARTRDPVGTLLACLSLPATALFVQHALGDRVQANWPAVIYPAAVIAAAGLSWRLGWAAAGLGFALTALVYVQGGWAPWTLGRRLDPTLRLAGFSELAAAVAARSGTGFVASESYGVASELAALLPRCAPVVAVGERWRLFDLPDGEPTLTAGPGLLLQSGRQAPAPARWQLVTELPGLERRRGGVVIERYRLFRVIGRPQAMHSAVLPCAKGAGLGKS